MRPARCQNARPDLPQRYRRRGLLGRFAQVGVMAVGGFSLGRRGGSAQEAKPTCAIVGITGGGVVRTAAGDFSLVLFASRFVDGGGQPAEGKVRWLDPAFEGGLSLESTGPVVYEDIPGDDRTREVRGIAIINGEFEAPFVLTVSDNATPGTNADTLDQCKFRAGSIIGSAGTPAATGWGYGASGDLVGGDPMLLGTENAPPA